MPTVRTARLRDEGRDAGGVGITFRRLAEADLPLLHRWLNEPGVVRWWEGDDVSWEAVVRDYGHPEDSTEHWIASLDGADLGWIQCWPVVEEAACEPWYPLGVERTAAGIDYLVGDPADRGRGFGAAMIRAFVADVVFGLHPAWTQACAAPYAANQISWKAVRNAGFRLVGTVQDRDGPCSLMVVGRADVAVPDAAERGREPAWDSTASSSSSPSPAS
jgi:aminoglycoside 6'-N-acetyltransferase